MSEEKEKKEAAKGPKVIAVYYALLAGLTFSVAITDKNGKRKDKFNIDGKKIGVESEAVSFINIQDSAVKGYLSQFTVTEETPDYIKDRLKRLAADPISDVLDQRAYVKKINPARAEAEIIVEKVKKENTVLINTVKEQDSKIKKLQDEMKKLLKK